MIPTSMFTCWSSRILRSYRKVLKVSDCKKRCIPVHKQFSTKNLNSSVDVLIIGGGAMGASSAYWLKEKSTKANRDLTVLVIEKDLTYQNCSTALSVGGIRQQFSVLENIQMSLFGADFLKNLKTRFGQEADVLYRPYGYLVLASHEGAQQLEDNFNLQQKLGACNSLLTRTQLKTKFPWLNVGDIEVGCLGGQKEGWFDPWALLSVLRNGANDNGAKFFQAEVVNFIFNSNGNPEGAVLKLPNNKAKTINFLQCLISAGAESGQIAKLANIGTGNGDLSVALPVERRKRYVYRFDSQSKMARPPPKSPLTIDFTGVYFRHDGLSYIGGRSPDPEQEPPCDNLDVDFEFFDSCIWPLLAARIPAFESAKIKSAWGGYYEYNSFDENGVIGPHPIFSNIFFATGFSGHGITGKFTGALAGIQQSPAVGLAIAELILDGGFRTVDLTRLGFNRLITQDPVYEIGIY